MIRSFSGKNDDLLPGIASRREQPSCPWRQIVVIGEPPVEPIIGTDAAIGLAMVAASTQAEDTTCWPSHSPWCKTGSPISPCHRRSRESISTRADALWIGHPDGVGDPQWRKQVLLRDFERAFTGRLVDESGGHLGYTVGVRERLPRLV